MYTSELKTRGELSYTSRHSNDQIPNFCPINWRLRSSNGKIGGGGFFGNIYLDVYLYSLLWCTLQPASGNQKSSSDLCKQFCLKDVQLQYTEADYLNLTNYGLFVRMVRPQVQQVSCHSLMFILYLVILTKSSKCTDFCGLTERNTIGLHRKKT